MVAPLTVEHRRLEDSQQRRADWKHWGPYLAERAWGTVREDYSPDGEAWTYFPHDHARSRTYRWNEDGLGGFSNRHQNLCLAVALWNERDPILKERLFGLTGTEGNHGEDVKEYYYYLDATPTHSYGRMLYKYPQVAYPYERLVQESRSRGYHDPEFELIDAIPEAWREGRYFDVFIEYAKADQEDLLCRITAWNRGPEPAPLHVLPHFWYRNNWSWGYDRVRPIMNALPAGEPTLGVYTRDRFLGDRWWCVDGGAESCFQRLLFTENETNMEQVIGNPNASPYRKDAFHAAVVGGRGEAVNPEAFGSKVAAHFQALIPPGGAHTVRVRFSDRARPSPFADFDAICDLRAKECEAFYGEVQPPELSEEVSAVQRQAFAGLLWSKQFYHFGAASWLRGDPGAPPLPERAGGRNRAWSHLYAMDVLSMPDKWEYPWFAAWDLAFHTLPIALIDPEWAKRQLVLLLREWYMHPNGQIPAYEWAFGDANPPVHGWAAWRVYKIDRDLTGRADTDFLERVFQKLLLNFTWWINRKDADGRNIFQGGFLGLDNIGLFNRSEPLPDSGQLEQADGTAWMGMYCLNLMVMALELARTRPVYEDLATKFLEHFVFITDAINRTHEQQGLWDEREGFYNDIIRTAQGRVIPLRIRSFVGLTPLFAVETLEADLLRMLPRFRARMEWFILHRQKLMEEVGFLTEPGPGGRMLFSLVNRNRLQRILGHMLNPDQFLSPFGLRSLSREHGERPLVFRIGDQEHRVEYNPAESTSGMFGGNSNWRGPIWFPVNYLMIESLQKFHHYYGDTFRVEFPTGSGQMADLGKVARELSMRLVRLFLQDGSGRRPFHGSQELFQQDPHWRDYLLFHEYFHGDDGRGMGAAHQTGWTALVAKLIQQCGAELEG